MNDRGASAVEMALLMPILLLMVLGLVDFGRVVLAHMAIEEAAQEGAMFAAYHGADAGDTSTDIVNAVRGSTTSVTIGAGEVAVVCSAKGGGDQLAAFPTVTVTISTSITPITPLVSGWLPGGIPLSAEASGNVFTKTCLATP
ncbi:MAG: pilus assembly protein [Acidimicrobiia bacterium]|nr:pilus assembly protein [Acidimicrobiia bacterium]MDH5504003.1 pilus assembly protein [Acidimicrobiia bacterium]